MFETYTEYLDDLERKFVDYFTDKKYLLESSVNITSQIDPTVDFIGSKISPLKHYILQDDIGQPGRCMIQNCIKLKSLHQLRASEPKMFGGYYKCMGLLAMPDLKTITNELFDFLTSKEFLGIPANDLCIRICSKDIDLLDAISDVNPDIRRDIDTVSLEHYRHVYGMDEHGITGRDYNIGLRRKGTDDFINCGTFVVMEKQTGIIAVDLGLGNLTFSMCHFGNKTSASSSRLADLYSVCSLEEHKMADTIMIIAALLRENILAHPSKHFRKKFRQYLNVMLFWNKKLCLSPDYIVDLIIQYLLLEYHEDYSIMRFEWRQVISNASDRYGR